MAVSNILHTFSIAPPLDEHGRPVRLVDVVKMSRGVIQYVTESDLRVAGVPG